MKQHLMIPPGSVIQPGCALIRGRTGAHKETNIQHPVAHLGPPLHTGGSRESVETVD